MRKVSVYKCPHCGAKYKSLQTWGNHITSVHPGMIPDGWSYARYLYFIQTGKRHGNCIVCKNETEWNDVTKKYERFCKNPKCKEEYREMFKKRMISKYGKVHLLDDPEQQRKMLANKKISGTYTFRDGVKVTYTGTYELDFLKMLDMFLYFNGNDILCPSPHTYYYDYINENDKEHEGKHFFIPDAYIPSLNLEIEIKQNTNTHPKLLKIDKVKEQLKDEMMKNLTGVNYIKIVEKDYSEFFDLIDILGNSVATESAIVKFDEKYLFREKKEIRNLSEFKFGYLDKSLVSAYVNNCKSLSEIVFSPNSRGEILVDNDNVVGYYIVEDVEGIIWLKHLYVSSEYRGTKLGRKLFTRALNQYKITNIAVDITNEIAINIFMQYGFVEYSRNSTKLFLFKP